MFNKKPDIVVIGDCMLDEYVLTSASGLTPEDPIAPKLRFIKEDTRLGGAANVALNLIQLGCNVKLLSVVGQDKYSDVIKNLCNFDALLIPDDRMTTRKVRYYTEEGRYICRVDYENTNPVSQKITSLFLDEIKNKSDFIVVSDYNKGSITEELMKEIQHRRFIVDPKKEISFYGKSLCIKPNEHEVDKNFDISQVDAQSVLVTLSKKGAVLKSQNRDDMTLNVRERKKGCAIGCGDNALAGLAYGLSTGLSLNRSCVLAMACGAVAADYDGVHAVTKEELEAELGFEEYK